MTVRKLETRAEPARPTSGPEPVAGTRAEGRGAGFRRLQSSYGNQAVQALIQAKAATGAPGDRWEVEADRVADRVAGATGGLAELRTRTEHETGADLSGVRLHTGSSADGLNRAASSLALTHGQDIYFRAGRFSPSTGMGRRLIAHEMTHVAQQAGSATAPTTQHQPDPLGGRPAPDGVADILRRRHGAGSALPGPIASSMSTGFGTDVSSVRVHTGPEAASVSRQLQSTAFSYGRDLYFGDGAYQPHTASGRELIAHEIAHTMQPGAAAGPVVGRADDPAEKAADARAHRALHTEAGGEPGAAFGLGTSRTIRRQLTNSGVQFAPVDASGQGVKAWVDRLGPGHTKGTDTNNSPTKDKDFRPLVYTQMFNAATDAAFYAQGHLVNDFLGGPGDSDLSTDAAKNLTAFPQKPTNQDHLRAIEQRIKDGTVSPYKGPKKWFRYEVEASYSQAPMARLLRRLQLTEKEFNAGWGVRTGIDAETQSHFRYASRLTATAQELDGDSTDASPDKIGDPHVVTMAIPNPVSYIKDLKKRDDEYPTGSGAASSAKAEYHYNAFKDHMEWVNENHPDKTGKYTTKNVSTAPPISSGRPYKKAKRWEGYEAAQSGTIKPANLLNTAYQAGTVSYQQGLTDARNGDPVAKKSKPLKSGGFHLFERTGAGYTSGYQDYRATLEEAADSLPGAPATGNAGAHQAFEDYWVAVDVARGEPNPKAAALPPTGPALPMAADDYQAGVKAAENHAYSMGIPPTTLTGGANQGFTDYMNGVRQAKNPLKTKPPAHPAEIKGFEDYRKGRNGKPYPGYRPFGYRVGKVAAAGKTTGPNAAKGLAKKAAAKKGKH